MSAKSSSKEDDSFPWITTDDMPKWDVLLRAYLKPKSGGRALDYEKPTLDEYRVLELLQDGEETRESRAYRKKHTTRVKRWNKRNAVAYAALVRATTYAPSALTVVLDNPEEDAKGLYEKLKERFDQGDMTGVVQAKLAAFNSMTLSSAEKAEDFINRLILAKI